MVFYSNTFLAKALIWVIFTLIQIAGILQGVNMLLILEDFLYIISRILVSVNFTLFKMIIISGSYKALFKEITVNLIFNYNYYYHYKRLYYYNMCYFVISKDSPFNWCLNKHRDFQ